MEEEHDRPLPPPPPSPRTKSLPTPDISLPDPLMFLPPEYLTSKASSIIPQKRRREKARPLPPDFLSSKVAQDIARRALTHPPSPSPRPSLLASPPPRQPKQLTIPASSSPPSSSSTKPTRPHIHITYKQCPHTENIVLSCPSSDVATPDKSAATTTSDTSTTLLDTKNEPGPTTPSHQIRCLPHKCPSCSRLEAIRHELTIRSRYRSRIRNLEYWIGGLRPRKEESGTAVHCALYEARVVKGRDLRDVKALRAAEIDGAWRDYEEVHGPRGEREGCSSEEEEGEIKTGSSLEDSSEGLGFMSVSGVASAGVSGGADSVGVISDEEGEGRMVVYGDHDGGQGEADESKDERGKEVDGDGDVRMTDPGDENRTRAKGKRKASSPKEMMEMSRNRLLNWRVGDDRVDEKTKNEWEIGGREHYAIDIDQQISRLKERLSERRLKNEQSTAKKRTSEEATPQAEQAEKGLTSKVVNGRGSKWKTI